MEEINRSGGRQKRDWAGIVEAQSKSGQTAGLYCREHDIPYKLFLYHRRKALRGNRATRTKKRRLRPSSSFVPVEVSSAGRIVLRMPSGIVLESDRFPDVDWLADLTKRFSVWGSAS